MTHVSQTVVLLVYIPLSGGFWWRSAIKKNFFLIQWLILLTTYFGLLYYCFSGDGLLGPCGQGESPANHVEHVECSDCVCHSNAQQVGRSRSWSYTPCLLSRSGKLPASSPAKLSLSFYFLHTILLTTPFLDVLLLILYWFLFCFIQALLFLLYHLCRVVLLVRIFFSLESMQLLFCLLVPEFGTSWFYFKVTIKTIGLKNFIYATNKKFRLFCYHSQT